MWLFVEHFGTLHDFFSRSVKNIAKGAQEGNPLTFSVPLDSIPQ